MKRSPMPRSTKRMKTSRPRMTPIRKAARSQECTLRFPVCNYNPETTALCHSNLLEDGKGMGLKAPDTAAAFGCSTCHDLLDGRMPMPKNYSRELMLAQFRAGVEHTHRILKRMGLEISID
ncbi:nuclease domain-containing protein [Undibacterium sp. TJN19]|uniref:nuclease domain-containing protein n=1 Tax=Undibacterium sp. TJN19 TaxID=3413055 RepID=UPI003BF36D1D